MAEILHFPSKRTCRGAAETLVDSLLDEQDPALRLEKRTALFDVYDRYLAGERILTLDLQLPTEEELSERQTAALQAACERISAEFADLLNRAVREIMSLKLQLIEAGRSRA